MMTALSVPICVTAVNAAPGSDHPEIAATMRRWALLEIGRNSVSPWTIPRTTASNQPTTGVSLRDQRVQSREPVIERRGHRGDRQRRHSRGSEGTHPLGDPIDGSEQGSAVYQLLGDR